MAQNVIVPIIDLTSAAEGSTVRQDLQTALAFGSQNVFGVSNTTTVVINSTGFWRVIGTANNGLTSTTSGSIEFILSDGLSTKVINRFFNVAYTGSGDSNISTPFDFILFLAAGESFSITAGSISDCRGSYRQIADINGNLVYPSGFTPQ
jgi:hypothetical protein